MSRLAPQLVLDPPQGIPFIHVTAETADALLAIASGEQADLAEIQHTANETGSVRHFPLWRKVEIATAVETPGYNTWNIAGVLPGTGALADEWVVVGGHYDHIGHGYTGSRAPGDDRVHPGADDNASGIGSILILVDRLTKAAAEDERESAIGALCGVQWRGSRTTWVGVLCREPTN